MISRRKELVKIEISDFEKKWIIGRPLSHSGATSKSSEKKLRRRLVRTRLKRELINA